MKDSIDESPLPAEPSNDRGIAIAIAIAIIICLMAFVVIFLELEPFMSDFTGGNVILTPDPSVVPVDGTATKDASPAP